MGLQCCLTSLNIQKCVTVYVKIQCIPLGKRDGVILSYGRTMLSERYGFLLICSLHGFLGHYLQVSVLLGIQGTLPNNIMTMDHTYTTHNSNATLNTS